jgi:uncharacterized protein
LFIKTEQNEITQMIPAQLLRVKVLNKGKHIAPIFCTSDEDLSLADNIIKGFEESCKTRERKALLINKIGLIESDYGDYKLVRGLFTLLERRCKFVKREFIKNEIDSPGAIVEPYVIRRKLFEKSSDCDFALTTPKRDEIIQSVASELGIDNQDVANEMWSDLDENLVLEFFDRITPTALLAWYNLALMQTLMFSCTALQIVLRGGSSWKEVLRQVKRVGLMYNIRNERNKEIETSSKDARYYDDNIVCSLDGPLSIFKMTDLYGTAIAKVLPHVISAESWSLEAWIIRNYSSVGRKIYEFHMSKENAPPLIGLPDNINSEENITTKSSYFDSAVEEKFALRFQQSSSGWTLIREPDPIIVKSDRAFIPDFMFERYGRRIYLEIVGFWTDEYIKRKIQKITRISSENKEGKIDIFIALDSNYYITPRYKNVGKDLLSKLSSSVQDGHLILYKNGHVPLKPILSYLKSIDQEMIRKFASATHRELLADIDRLTASNNQQNDSGVISISMLAEKYNIPSESVLLALQSMEAGLNVLDNSYVIVGTYLIPRSKILELQESLNFISSFTDAVLLFTKYKVPESCHVDLISKLGYDIIWRGIDSTNACLEKRRE